jgi:glucose/arabinose dehydrogenase
MARMSWRWLLAVVPFAVLASTAASRVAAAACEAGFLTGPDAANSDWSTDQPGLCRQILVADLPPPSPSLTSHSRVVPRPEGAWPQVPPGFGVVQFYQHDDKPRLLRAAPNGDIFVAENYGGRVRILRPSGVCRYGGTSVFAEGLNLPFGIAFYPPGPAPQYVYVAETDKVVRFPYQNGALVAAAAPEFVAALPQGAGQLPGQGHWTRDVAFSADGGTMFVSVGSYSNVQEGGEDESNRAAILAFGPDGSSRGVYASGLRNPVSLAVSPVNGALWTSVNERDGLGDNLVPAFVTSVAPGQFFGWPWFYLGAHVDPRHPAADPAGHPPVALPEVLLQAHSASLGSAFYVGQQFPPEYHGSLFLAEHGSWNRSNPTGSKVIRVVFDAAGAPQPYYEDFVTGFVVANHDVWGRPAGIAVDPAGSLFVSEDANNVTWCVARADLLP